MHEDAAVAIVTFDVRFFRCLVSQKDEGRRNQIIATSGEIAVYRKAHMIWVF